MSAPEPRLKAVLIGYGRMGRAVEAAADGFGIEIVARIDAEQNRGGTACAPGALPHADVAIDFSTGDAFIQNFPGVAACGMPVVVGTTGWQAQVEAMKAIASAAGIGVVAAANFSIGVAVFDAVVAEAARRFAAHAEFGAWLHEIHHAAKRDAPSGTALRLRASMQAAGFARPIDVSSSRAGFVPGTHTVGFDGPSDTITLTHAARDRGTFARGALAAARWLQGRRGWFEMRDVLNLECET